MFAAPAAADKKPVFYLYFGDDSLAMQKLVQEMVARMGDPSMADMNTTRLVGEQTSVEEIHNAAFALPFLAERRLVFVSQALNLVKGAKQKEAIQDLLEKLPQSTALVFLVETERDRKTWKDFDEKHWLRKWVSGQPSTRVYQKECSLPTAGAMRQWIMDEARRQKGQFIPAAAQELASHVGTNTQMASLEIDKLLTYVNLERPVEVEDVKELVPDVSPVNIFDMVDAVADGNSKKATHLLHTLLEKDEVFGVFAMIVRQFRLLLMAREVLDQGGQKDDIARLLNVHPFVADKLEKQGKRFSLARLEEIYHHLLSIDEDMKTSRMNPLISLDLFINQLTMA
jgi:DNA polymerase-3 subunit delta